MNEREFWKYLEAEWKKGRVPMLSCVMKSDDPQLAAAGRYMESHALLPSGYEKIPSGVIADMGTLLSRRDVSLDTKEAIMIILAHHSSEEALVALGRYNLGPDKGLELFARIAFDECEANKGFVSLRK